MGISVIIFTLVNIAINLGIMAYSTVKEAHRRWSMRNLKARLIKRRQIKAKIGVLVPVTKT